MKKILRKIPPKYRAFIPFIVVFVIIVSLSLTLGDFMVKRLLTARENSENLKRTNSILKQKKQSLETLPKDQLLLDTKKAVSAIPGENSTLVALSTIRNLAVKNGVDLADFRVSESDKTQQTRVVEVQIDMRGNLSNMFVLLEEIKTYAPLMRVASVSVTNSTNLFHATIKVVALWAPLPTVLAKIDQPLELISSSEQELINKLSQLQSVEQLDKISQPTGRTNPFEI